MERSQNKLEFYTIIILIIFFSVGIIGHLIDYTLPLMKLITPFSLLATNGVVFYFTVKNSDAKYLYWFILTYLITFALEALGVNYGYVFGSYSYGKTLGISFLGVPLIIGFNWVIVIIGAVKLSEKFSNSVIIVSLLTGLSAFIFDYILEPTAIKLNYWQWENDVIPVSNYIAWIIIAFIASLCYKLFKVKVETPLPYYYLLVQAVFFVILGVFL